MCPATRTQNETIQMTPQRTLQSVRGGMDSVVWDEDLLWELDDDEYKRLVASGSTVKLVLERSNGARCGFLVLDLRTAKLNGQHRAEGSRARQAFTREGVRADPRAASWKSLAGSARGKDHVELQVAYQLQDAGASGAASSSRAGGGETELSREILRRKQALMRSGMRPASAPGGRSNSAGGRRRARGGVRDDDDAPRFQRQSGGRPTTRGEYPENSDVEPIRRFKLTVQYISVKLSTSLPLEKVTVVVTASLPKQLETLVVKSRTSGRGDALPVDPIADALGKEASPEASLAAARHNVSSRPAVDAFRGVESILPRGEMEVELEAGAVHLAALLAAGCRIVAKLWHHDSEATPSKVLLGVSSIPLSQLLGGELIEGYAPVVALEKGAQVEVARLRAMLALEELGIVDKAAAVHDAAVVATRSAGAAGAEIVAEDSGAPVGSGNEEQASPSIPTTESTKPEVVQPLQTTAPVAAHVMVEDTNTGRESSAPAAKAADVETSIREGREYAIAWELELWRQAEEAKFHAGLRSLETAKIASLESDYKRKESQRMRDMHSARSETESLQKKLRERLAEVESRETSLIHAEEKLSARSASLERMRTQGVHDAITSAKRVQDEAEHAVRVETARATAAMHRAQTAETRVAELEAAVDDYRRKLAQLTPEVTEVARLKAELALRDRAVAAAGRRVADALQAAKMWKVRYTKVVEHQQAQRQMEQQRASMLLHSMPQSEAVPSGDGDVNDGRSDDTGSVAKERHGTKKTDALRDLSEAEVALEARRLIQERSSLLLSGAYRENDHLIQKLDRKIAQLVPPSMM